VTVLVEVFV
jgi:hypothetical protein